MAFLQIIKSLLAAILGVRSQKEAEEDFKQIDWRWYVLFGCIAVLFFILIIVITVNIILH
jgi:hypothetical protein